ncbi:hypothetical protein H5410_032417 [Solanum commersonii]|uniref:Uncharacterized protein n=1 Tax=Solanum commersonii TaxID=4109 RepID=A0A9J5YMT9_SOLCO|nr:hypothetical protein H5410_032417 [Solanum commersonii]
MFKKLIETPRKSPRFDGTSIDVVHVPSFNILSQTPLHKTVEISATGGSSRLKNKKDKNNEAKESMIPTNQKGKKRRGKHLLKPLLILIPIPIWILLVKQKRKKSTNVEIAQTSKPSTRRKTKKKESELPKYKNPKKVVRYHHEKYATILWHYGKTKNEDGAITTGTVASKFGGPRIAKEHVPDTTNYPTPRPLIRNLK